VAQCDAALRKNLIATIAYFALRVAVSKWVTFLILSSALVSATN
jgi:hypothetical protein